MHFFIIRALFFILLVAPAFATNYYVTQSGAASPLSTSSGSPSSVATYNASALPTGGDTVFFSGIITSQITVATSGTGNGAGRLILDFSGAQLNMTSTTTERIICGGKSYVTYEGGGFWTQSGSGVDSTWHSGCTFGAIDSTDPNNNPAGGFDFRQQACHDITIHGFDCTANTSSATAGFIRGAGASAMLVSENNVLNISNFIYSDTSDTHDIILRNNYFQSSVNVLYQSDCVVFADCRNITIEGNKFVLCAPGAQAGGRHNDMFQVYESGASSHQSCSGIIIRYNWYEQRITSSNGDGSITFTQLEEISDVAGFAIKMYGNIFYGNNSNPTYANGGITGGDALYSHSCYFYGNTYPARATPSGSFGWNGTGSLYIRNNAFWSPSSLSDGSGTAVTMTAGAPWNKNFFFNWNDATSTLCGANGSLVTNPNFTAQASADFSLGASSTLRAIGDNTIGSEFGNGVAFGSTWPNPTIVSRGSSWDIGAYQFIAGGGATFSSSLSGKVILTGKVQIK